MNRYNTNENPNAQTMLSGMDFYSVGLALDRLEQAAKPLFDAASQGGNPLQFHEIEQRYRFKTEISPIGSLAYGVLFWDFAYISRNAFNLKLIAMLESRFAAIVQPFELSAHAAIASFYAPMAYHQGAQQGFEHALLGLALLKRHRQFLEAMSPSSPDWIHLAFLQEKLIQTFVARQDNEEWQAYQNPTEIINRLLQTTATLLESTLYLLQKSPDYKFQDEVTLDCFKSIFELVATLMAESGSGEIQVLSEIAQQFPDLWHEYLASLILKGNCLVLTVLASVKLASENIADWVYQKLETAIWDNQDDQDFDFDSAKTLDGLCTLQEQG
ncbi:hypothetical protein ACQ4M3_07315 [Leptolyngbya sp. AN03gr2]|uniref:hypothetical protein n=1 Tax=unclassified Leptolyngbya TaxID=2650499 RepID=UPI003D31971D